MREEYVGQSFLAHMFEYSYRRHARDSSEPGKSQTDPGKTGRGPVCEEEENAHLSQPNDGPSQSARCASHDGITACTFCGSAETFNRIPVSGNDCARCQEKRRCHCLGNPMEVCRPQVYDPRAVVGSRRRSLCGLGQGGGTNSRVWSPREETGCRESSALQQVAPGPLGLKNKGSDPIPDQLRPNKLVPTPFCSILVSAKLLIAQIIGPTESYIARLSVSSLGKIAGLFQSRFPVATQYREAAGQVRIYATAVVTFKFRQVVEQCDV